MGRVAGLEVVPEAVEYRDALRRLFARTGGAWRLGLDRVATLLSMLGEPQSAYPVFHVAGTNGKGSTVATLDELLRSSGLRVGRYTSPHLVDFSERIVVDGVPIGRQSVTSWLARWEPDMARMGATFFEATTALALAHFASEHVDVAVVEVGLGGRLDATNIVQPVAAAVTQIGVDHVEYLGETLQLIALEKAGVFKRDAVAVIGETRSAIRALLAERAVAAGASAVLTTDRDWHVRDVEVSAAGTRFILDLGGRARHLQTPLVGAFQAHNAAVAIAMLHGAGGRWRDIADNAAHLLGGVRLAGRFHRWGRWLFDVAHNPDGAATVAANLLDVGVSHPIVAVVCVLRDKDWRGILQALSAVADEIILTSAPTAPASREWNLTEVEEWVRAAGISAKRIDDFGMALDVAETTGSTILVTGSFHTVGDAMERLQVDPLAR